MLHRKEGCVTTLKMTAKETTFSVDKFFNGLMATTDFDEHAVRKPLREVLLRAWIWTTSFKPFAPEPPVTALADAAPFYRL